MNIVVVLCIVFLLVGASAGLIMGIGLLFFTHRIYRWSVDRFYSWLDRFGRKLYGKYYEPPADPYRPFVWLIWWGRLIGAGLTVMCAFGLYGIVITFIL